MKIRPMMFVLPVVAAAAGCTSDTGGSGDLLTPDSVFDTELPLVTDLQGLPQEAVEAVNAFSTLNDADLAEPMTSGTATYTGVVGFAVSEDNAGGTLLSGTGEDTTIVIGDATINADFDALSVDGSFDNLVAFDAQAGNVELGALAGSLDITNGVITDSRYTADFGGDLTLDSDTYGVDGTLDGAFVGDGTDSIGILDGTVTNPDTTVDLLNGLFVVTSD